MVQKREFDRLEQFVGRLLTQFDQLREEKQRLETRLSEKETEIVNLQEELSSADTARGVITNRVKGLIDQIEEWEAASIETEGVPASTDVVPDPVLQESEEEDKEGGAQQNLFNVEPRSTSMD